MNVIRPESLKTNYSDPDLAEIVEKIIKPEVAVEKAGYKERQSRIARLNHRLGSQQQEAMGQKIGSVDLATYIRWNQMVPGCWDDPGFVKKFLADNEDARCKTISWR